ncbi:MAG: ATP-grasp domain-containing protein [Patescibacteria group bacterium]
MAEFHEAQQRDLILFVGGLRDEAGSVVSDYETKYQKKVRALYMGNVNSADFEKKASMAYRRKIIELPIEFKKLNATSISKALAPYTDRLLTATCTREYNIRVYKKIIPHIPYLFAPTQESMDWATDKVEMRQRIREKAPDISPKFMLVEDLKESTIKKVEKSIRFPLVVKPAGLAASKHVTVCYYREEFEKSLKQIMSSLKKLYLERNREDKPKVLVEEFMDGVMYSIDAYVNARGYVYHCPPVHVKTGATIGFDDFFGYMRMTPVQLKDYKIERAEQAVTRAIHALGLRNVSCHVELMKTEDGWKIIEVGPRVGGYRHDMYEIAYGINHLLNDVLIRIPQKPVLKTRPRNTVAVLQFFSKKEGVLESIEGIKKVPKLESFKKIKVKLKEGDMCKFAKNGGSSVFEVMLANKSRSQVLADVRRIEKNVKIIVNSSGTKTK